MQKIDLNIVNKTDIKIPSKQLFRRAILEILESKKIKSDIAIGIEIVKPSQIKKLNAKYRKKDSSTDVLSFPIYEVIPKKSEETMLLGDIVVCPDCARDDILFLIQHATLHLLGYHHS